MGGRSSSPRHVIAVLSALVGTEQGVTPVGEDGHDELQALADGMKGQSVAHMTRSSSAWYAALEEGAILRSSPDGMSEQIGSLSEGTLLARCLAPHPMGLLIGTSDAHLFQWRDGRLEQNESFEHVSGRDEWYTPWGGPPDVRSISVDEDGAIFANVHVGGVVRSTDGGKSWHPTMDIDMDVHQVLVHPSRRGQVFAASARGLGISDDGAGSWTFVADGLHAAYCRAVAVGGEHVLVSASSGPRGSRAAVYRRRLDGSGAFVKCQGGLPEWFDGNIDTFCLAAAGSQALLAAPDGSLFASADDGATWQAVQRAGGPPARFIALS